MEADTFVVDTTAPARNCVTTTGVSGVDTARKPTTALAVAVYTVTAVLPTVNEERSSGNLFSLKIQGAMCSLYLGWTILGDSAEVEGDDVPLGRGHTNHRDRATFKGGGGPSDICTSCAILQGRTGESHNMSISRSVGDR